MTRTPRGTMTWQDRLWSKVAPADANGCRIWLGASTPTGYGTFYGAWDIERNKNGPAHRWAYIATYGSIPKGLQIDHLCNVRACVNPEHLEPVTASENIRRGHARRKARAAVEQVAS